MKKFGMTKHKLLQTWLTSSKDEASKLINDLRLPIELNNTGDSNQFFEFLNKFEAEIESGMHSQNQSSQNPNEKVNEDKNGFEA